MGFASMRSIPSLTAGVWWVFPVSLLVDLCRKIGLIIINPKLLENEGQDANTRDHGDHSMSPILRMAVQ